MVFTVLSKKQKAKKKNRFLKQISFLLFPRFQKCEFELLKCENIVSSFSKFIYKKKSFSDCKLFPWLLQPLVVSPVCAYVKEKYELQIASKHTKAK